MARLAPSPAFAHRPCRRRALIFHGSARNIDLSTAVRADYATGSRRLLMAKDNGASKSREIVVHARLGIYVKVRWHIDCLLRCRHIIFAARR